MPTYLISPGVWLPEGVDTAKLAHLPFLHEDELHKPMSLEADLSNTRVVVLSSDNDNGESLRTVAATAALVRIIAEDDHEGAPPSGVPMIVGGAIQPRSTYPGFPVSGHERDLDIPIKATVRRTGLNGALLDLSEVDPQTTPEEAYIRIIQSYCAARDAMTRVGLPPNQAIVLPAINADAAIQSSIDRDEVIMHLAAQIQALNDLAVPLVHWFARPGDYDSLEKAVITEAFGLAEKVAL